MRRILITGGAGFVGHNLALSLKKQNPDDHIICFDNLIRKGSELNIDTLREKGIEFIKGDVRNKEELLALTHIDLIIECSAEPAVLAAYDDPTYTIDTNLIGTIHCLELAKRDQSAMLFLSTSRVYPIEALNAISYEETSTRFDWPQDYAGVSEDFSLNGVRSLYGATKLASEHIICEYADMFGLKVLINRLGVIAGPGQMGKIDQGIVGFWVAQHMLNGALSYIGYGGSGKQVRDVVHIDDVCELITKQLQSLDQWQGDIFNVGGGRKNTFSLCELTQIVQEVTGKTLDINSISEERKSDVRIYITDNTKVQNAFSWTPKRSVRQIVEDTHNWITNSYEQLEVVFK